MKENFTGWIKPGNYGSETINGFEFIKMYPWWAIPILRVVKFLQKTFWLCGIAIHDPIFGECTPDFNCCCKGIGRKVIIRIAS